MLTRLFLICAFSVCISALSFAQMSFTEFYLESMERAQDYTLELVEIMPEDKFTFKPVPEVSTFHDQVTHVIKNIGFLQTYITENRDSPIRDLDLEDNSKEELLYNLKIAFSHLEKIAKILTPEDLSKPVDFFAKGVQMDKRGILLLIKNHMTLHQGQMIVYLRLNGFTPPTFNGY